MSDIRFGTDGWRGRIADDYTFANVRRATQGFADYLRAIGHRDASQGAPASVVVGYDRRFLAEHFAATAAEVLAGNGFHVWLTPTATPTPVISFSVPTQGAVAAVNLTASHNPPEDCGFKVRDQQGGAIAPDGLALIESLIPETGNSGAMRSLPLREALASGLVEYFDPRPAYMTHIQSLID
ncbi:MAG: phosphoglucomutase/phosphomannomutase family protein, partial [Caldilineaceae bacterium]